MLNIVFWILRFTWELPQTLLGFLVLIAVKAFGVKTNNLTSFYFRVKGFGVSLGGFVFFDDTVDKWVAYHEEGHTIQSRILGPLYLLVVGLPSLIFNILTIFDILKPSTYYLRFPENWADKLGGVKRTSDITPAEFGVI